MPHHFDWAIDGFGNALSGATVTVYLAGTSTTASLYSDAALSTSKTNPLTADSTGYYSAYIRPGKYKVKIEKAGFTTVEIDNVSIVEQASFDPRNYGNLYTGGDVSAVIQLALDAAASAGGGTVTMPAGVFRCQNLLVDSFVYFDLGGCELEAADAATGFMVGNKTSSSKGYRISNGKIDCRGASVHGILLDHGGGSYGSDYADPEPQLWDLRVQNTALDGFRLVGARVVHAIRCRARACTGDGFSLLAGTPSSDQTNDCLFVACSASSCRDLVHIETSTNSFVGFKGGEADRYGIYGNTSCVNSNFSGCIIDHCATANYWIEGKRNSFTACGNQNGPATGSAIVFGAAAERNVYTGWVWSDTSEPEYAVSFTAGATKNEVHLGSVGTATGTVDPASDLAVNIVTINGEYHGARVVGKTDIRQLHVTGNATQTTPVATFEKSDGTDLLTVLNSGILEVPSMAVNAGGAGGTGATAVVAPGTWTPTITSLANVAASTPRVCNWVRIGPMVICWGAVDIDPTAGSTRTAFALNLPVASNLALLPDLAGAMAVDDGATVVGGSILADTTNDRAQFVYVCDAGAASETVSFIFGYQVK